jgi:hypothetical protein
MRPGGGKRRQGEGRGGRGAALCYSAPLPPRPPLALPFGVQARRRLKHKT